MFPGVSVLHAQADPALGWHQVRFWCYVKFYSSSSGSFCFVPLSITLSSKVNSGGGAASLVVGLHDLKGLFQF